MQSITKIKTVRWDDAEWARVGEIANSVGLTRSAFVRRATRAALLLPSALCGPNFGAHNATSDPSDPLRKRSPKEIDSLEVAKPRKGQNADGDSQPRFEEVHVEK